MERGETGIRVSLVSSLLRGVHYFLINTRWRRTTCDQLGFAWGV